MNNNSILGKFAIDLKWFLKTNFDNYVKFYIGCTLGIFAAAGLPTFYVDDPKPGIAILFAALGSIAFISPIFSGISLSKRELLFVELTQPSSKASKYIARLVGTAIAFAIVLPAVAISVDILQWLIKFLFSNYPAGSLLLHELFNWPDDFRNFNLAPLFLAEVWFLHSLFVPLAFIFRSRILGLVIFLVLWLTVGHFYNSLESTVLFGSSSTDVVQWVFTVVIALLAAANYYWGYRLYASIQFKNKKFLLI